MRTQPIFTSTFAFVAVLLISSCGSEGNANNGDSSTTDSVTAQDTSRSMNDNGSSIASGNVPVDVPSLFYWDYTANKGIQAPEAVPVDEAVKIMDNLAGDDGNMFGMIRGENEVVQFMYQDGRGLVLDIPNVTTPVDKVVTKEQGLKIIRDFYSGKSADDIAAAY